MFSKSLKSISILFKYAPGLTVLKILQIAIAAVAVPMSIYFTQRIIDIIAGVVTGENQIGALAVWVALMCFAMFFSSVGGGYLNGILYIAIKRKLNTAMTPDILEKFKRLDYACFEDSDVQDTLNRMSSDPQDKVLQLFLTILGVMECFISFVGAALIFSQVGWWMIAGFAALLAPMIWLDFKTADIMNTMMNEQSPDERRMNYFGKLLSGKSALYELKLFRATDYIITKWRAIAQKVLNERIKTTLKAQKIYLMSIILFKCWSFFIVLSLIYALANGNITIGVFTALIASTGAVLDNADMLSHAIHNMRKRYLLIEHYYNFMALPETQYGNTPISGAQPRIVFENVYFTYPKTNKAVLKGVSFDIRPGEHIALVGENGAGKSTIIKLLCRLYAPDSGRILINGADIRALDANAVKRVFSVVFQDYFKYQLTLRENIAFGEISQIRDDAALERALKMGHAEDIAQLDTPLGKLEEAGVDISGGRWQRIAVARACLPSSAFVVLDEPTASLDPVAESAIYESFAEVLKNRGCIMISHRLASAKMADKILVLSQGVVKETGSHAQLMARGGLYANMFLSQSAWYTSGGEPA